MGKGAYRKGLVGRTLAGFAGVALLVCVIFAFLFAGQASMKTNADQARRAERIVLLNSLLNRYVIDLETGVRGRLLTGDDQYLQPYRDAQRAIPAVERQLDAETKNAAQRRRLAILRERVEGYRTGWATMAAGLPLGTPRADVDQQLANGKAQIDDLRRRFDVCRDE